MRTTDHLDTIWRFARGDVAAADFERWLYAHPELEAALGPERYLALISADYRDRRSVHEARRELEAYARQAAGSMACECAAVGDVAVVDMAPDVAPEMAHFRELARRGEPYWWLGLSRCEACGTPWLVAQEERQNDVFVLRRLSEPEAAGVLEDGRWPGYLDAYATLLRAGREAGRRVVFVDPLGDSSLAVTMGDLARERPGIGLRELAELLNLDAATAAAVADQATLRYGARITRDDGELW